MSAVIGPTVIVHKDDYAYISHPSITCLEDGEWVAAFIHSRRRVPNQHPPGDPLFRTMIARSSDRGQSWDALTGVKHLSGLATIVSPVLLMVFVPLR